MWVIAAAVIEIIVITNIEIIADIMILITKSGLCEKSAMNLNIEIAMTVVAGLIVVSDELVENLID